VGKLKEPIRYGARNGLEEGKMKITLSTTTTTGKPSEAAAPLSSSETEAQEVGEDSDGSKTSVDAAAA
jgi:hypothetical protein